MRSYGSMICRYFYIGVTDFMFKGKSLADFIHLFSAHDFETNDKVTLNYFLN